MAGFKLIESYLSSESADSADEDEESTNKPFKKSNENDEKNAKLPLPSSIKTWMEEGSKSNNENDDELRLQKHNGKVRSFEHERGNWATLVYIHYVLNESLESWMMFAKSILPIDTHLITDLCHISLTKTLVLKFHWIESFVNSMKLLCLNTPKFTIELNTVKVYCNEERTRTFVGVKCECYDHNFIHLAESIDRILAEYQLPPFYKDASYHISLLWALGDKEDELKPHLPELINNLNQTLSNDLKSNYINVSEIHCKIGNKMYRFLLR